ncbi:MAG TPA: cupin domain-containing protein [Victivallales bacterium]|nr:cupin domain-containing protein [Victivallales bacterium]
MNDQNLASSPAKLKSLVEYSPNSIVSREIIDRDSGSMTAFAFDAGQKLSEHSAPYDAAVFVMEGKGIFTIAGKENLVSDGELIVMPADIPHAVKAKEKFKMLLTMIRK